MNRIKNCLIALTIALSAATAVTACTPECEPLPMPPNATYTHTSRPGTWYSDGVPYGYSKEEDTPIYLSKVCAR